MRGPSLSDRLRYAFDSTLARSPLALVSWVGMASAAVILLIAATLYFSGLDPDHTFAQMLYTGLIHLLNANPDEGNWPFLVAMLGAVFVGVFLTSSLIGLLTAGVQDRLVALRKGRSRVIEDGHTVILGWSEQVFTIVSELVVANENKKSPCIAILADKDQGEMEGELRAKVGGTRNTRVVCRSGSPLEVTDLDIVSPATCHSIIVLTMDGDDPDGNVIKTILAVTNSPHRRAKPYHIVAQIHDPRNLDIAKMVGRDEVELVLGGDLVARIIAQTCHQSGLTVVYTELLNFEGDEIYFQAEPRLVGKTFAEAILAYEDSAVMGVYTRDGVPLLNPPMHTPIQDGDQVIAVSRDDDTVVLSQLTDLAIREDAIVAAAPASRTPERTLILGWNWRTPRVINELAAYAAPGSEVTVVADFAEAGEQMSRLCAPTTNQTATFVQRDIADRRSLDELDVPSYRHVILMSDSDRLDVQRADAKTLIILLHLRDIREHVACDLSIVSEMLDLRNRNLAEVTRADDYIVSDKLISLLLTQVSENKVLNKVFDDLFDAQGSEVFIKPMSGYIKPGVTVNYYTVAEAARRRSEVALGYRIKAKANDADGSYGVVINPKKSAMVTFARDDSIIVLAEEWNKRANGEAIKC